MTVPAWITILPFTLIRTGLPPMKKTLSDAAKLRVTIHDEDGSKTTANYRIFVDCGGQEPLELQDYPFPSLVDAGIVSKGRVRFADSAVISALEDEVREHVFEDQGESVCHVGGVDIDSACRLISAKGVSSPRIADVAFPHTSGLRPYSYGLQCCSDRVAIFVQAWVQELRSRGGDRGELHRALQTVREDLTKSLSRFRSPPSLTAGRTQAAGWRLRCR